MSQPRRDAIAVMVVTVGSSRGIGLGGGLFWFQFQEFQYFGYFGCGLTGKSFGIVGEYGNSPADVLT